MVVKYKGRVRATPPRHMQVSRDKIESLQICPSSVGIMSVGNMRENTSNEWNQMNYTEELRKSRNFFLAHDAKNSKINHIQEKKYTK